MAKLKDGKIIRDEMYAHLVKKYTGVTAPEWSVRKMLETAYRFESEERTLDGMLHCLKPRQKMKILDVGCGFGHFIAYAISKGYDCYGYEVDENLVKISKSILKINDQNPNRIKLAKGKKLPYKNESFDLVNLSFVLDFVQDIPSLLKEIKRILKKDGEIYIEAPNYQCCFSPLYAIIFFPWLPKWLNRAYFHLMGRPNTKMIESLNFITPWYLERLFQKYNLKVNNFGLKFWDDLIGGTDFTYRNDKLTKLIIFLNKYKLGWTLKLLARLGFYTPLHYVLAK